ncbi:ATP-binding protein [Gordonia phthalatica]|uniref:ATPase AAA n=1 Tax=Gordonia phthalatica TaxID=1136941 RepID=A0A0N9NEF4_9ACTN|nr:ATP-binding protein [Gordonia phthalatica]ALG83958.1 ATPase AAA [Gordonia phthalatica]
MRSVVNNPFVPGSDVVPPVWAGRAAQADDWEGKVRARRVAGLYERGRVILGEPGLGKSSLVRRLSDHAASRGDWVTPQLRIPVGADPMKSVATAVLKLADQAGISAGRDRQIKELLERVRSIEIAGMALSIDRRDGPEPYAALTDLLIKVGLAAAERRVAVFVHVDEVQNITDVKALSQLLVCLGDVLGYEHDVVAPGGYSIATFLPVIVYLTGLPEFADSAGARMGATFARRFAWETLEPIDDADILQALNEFVSDGWEVSDGEGGIGRVGMTPAAAEAIVDRCCGEPFLFQLAGERAWDAGSSAVVTVEDVVDGWRSAETEAEHHVERILDRLPDREREFLEAMSQMGPEKRTPTAIAVRLGLETAAQVGTTAKRLDSTRGIIRRGKPYSFRHRAVEAYLTTDWPHV